MPAYFRQRLGPALTALLEAAAVARAIRPGVDPSDLLWAVGSLCSPASYVGAGHARRMVALLVDGLQYGAHAPSNSRGAPAVGPATDQPSGGDAE